MDNEDLIKQGYSEDYINKIMNDSKIGESVPEKKAEPVNPCGPCRIKKGSLACKSCVEYKE